MQERTPTKKYDAIIQSVEDKILSINSGETVEADDIAKEVAFEQGFYGNDRALSEIMKFFTGKPFNTYIKERRIMLASQRLISDHNKYDVSQVLDIAGYDNESSFSKAFKKRFDITPKEFWLGNETHLIEKPLFWSTINEVESDFDNYTTYGIPESQKAMIYGITKEQYEHLLEIQQLQTFYGFNDSLTQIVVEFADTMGIELRASFKYADDRELVKYTALLSIDDFIEELTPCDISLDFLDQESDYDIIKYGNEIEKELIRDKYIKKYKIPQSPNAEQMYQILLGLGRSDEDVPICLLPEDKQANELRKLIFDENEYYLYFKCGLSCDETYDIDWDDIENSIFSSIDLAEYPPELLRAYVRNNSGIKFNTLYKRYQYFNVHFKGTGNIAADSRFKKKYLMLIAAKYYPDDAFAITIANGKGVNFDVDPKITDIPLNDLRRRLLRFDDMSENDRTYYATPHDYDNRLDEEDDDDICYYEGSYEEALIELKRLENSYVEEIKSANDKDIPIYPEE